LWRSVPSAAALSPGLASAARARTTDADEAAATGALLVTPQTTAGYAWEDVSTTPAALLPAYSAVAATLSDSTAATNPPPAVMVEARTSSSDPTAARWFSAPDSGYSVDNLPPAAIAGLTGQYVAGKVQLFWNPNLEPDLAGYLIYRGAPSTFTPSSANLLTT